MNALSPITRFFSQYRPRAFVSIAVVIAAIVGFLVAPWTLEDKTYAALHGLCAQIPSHTYLVGDRPLPFDARMTGIYLGFAATSIYLLARGRGRAVGTPAWKGLALLTAFIAIMGIDGTNSLFRDLGLNQLYEPRNDLRLATGLLTGVTLSVMIVFLVASTVWRQVDNTRATVSGVKEVVELAALQVPIFTMVTLAPAVLYAPIALSLLASAIAVVSGLSLVLILLVTKRDGGIANLAELQPIGSAAVVVGVTVMTTIASLRFWFEALTGYAGLP